MAFFNLPILILGSSAVAVPIILHLIMRQRPKRQVFPALRLLKQRETANTRRLRLRHLLLLALRCSAILLLAAALARPHVASAALGNWAVASGLLLLTVASLVALIVGIANRRGRVFVATLAIIGTGLALVTGYAGWRAVSSGTNVLLGNRESPITAVVVIDTSVRMDYRHENQTHLERAKGVAETVVRGFPEDSEMAIVDARLGPSVFSTDLGAALRSIHSLESAPASGPLPDVILSALELLEQSKHPRRELHIVTDLTAVSWTDRADRSLTDRLERAADVAVYVIDVGIETVRNRSIEDIRLSEDTVAAGSTLDIEVRVAVTPPETAAVVRLLLEEPNVRPPVVVDGKIQGVAPTVRGRQELTLDEDGRAVCRFPLGNLSFGTYHGSVELDAPDALPIDDRRYFALQVREPWPVLVVAGPDTMPEFFTDLLAPLQFRETGRARYEFQDIPVSNLDGEKFGKFSAICLLDPPALSSSNWQTLERYVSRGGGLAIFLGRNAAPAGDFNSPAAMTVLPAPIKRTWHSPEGVFLAPTDYAQSILSPFREIASTVPWDALPVYKHWVVGDLSQGATTVVSFGNGKPAIIERILGEGRIILMTTPVSDDPNRVDREAWNLLPVGEDSVAWPFLILADRMLQRLFDADSFALNYAAGEVARVRVSDKPAVSRIQVVTPELDWQELTAEQGLVQIPFTESIGAYRVYRDDGTPVGGFATNLAPGATRLDRVDSAKLDALLGLGRYDLARDPAEITREVDQERVGRDFYPFLVLALVVTMAMEHLLSNRFYTV
jgi:hypothetical protein